MIDILPVLLEDARNYIVTWNGKTPYASGIKTGGASFDYNGYTDLDAELTTHGIYDTYVVQNVTSLQVCNTLDVTGTTPNLVTSTHMTLTYCYCRLKRRHDGQAGKWVCAGNGVTTWGCPRRCASYAAAAGDYGFSNALKNAF
jgi:hypothetical protein